ncbi:hypothetical protein BDQ17DRAFT_1368040 [Cyathus striatus]|nr:hypothetical protein BDQ17DRAFT_1368040 [Cyathus striatus]
MKITVKTTQQKVFQVDVEPADTVAALKQKIQESQGHSTTLQKIIYSGKILSDDKTIESCGIKEKDFLVLMVSKPKSTVANTPASSATPVTQLAAASASVPETAPAASVSTDSPVSTLSASVPTVASSAPLASVTQFGDSNSFLSGAALQTTINNMVEMGFSRDQVLRAMRASFNNADRAVEYLMNGIPDHLEAEEAPAPAASPSQSPSTAPPATEQPSAPATLQSGQPQNLFQLAQQQQQQQQAGVGRTGFASGSPGPHQLNLEALRNNPQLQQLRQQIAENPTVVQPLIQQLAENNPAFAQLIAQNPDALLRFLSGNDADDESGSIPPGAHVISVTEEERAAIERLEALGFSREEVVEAYFACDKNEELAANYLFERGYDG